jgi:ABC-type antimicrobial peptide transport system permease subunit
MIISDYFRLCFKNLWRNKARSFLTILAVIIGTISVVIMLSLVIGAKNLATQQIEDLGGFTLMTVSANPDMEFVGSLLSTDQSFDSTHKLNDSIIDSIKKINHVVNATPIANAWVSYVVLEGSLVLRL